MRVNVFQGESTSRALARANHTGTQLAATISDFSEAVDDRVGTLLTAGSNITLTYNDGAGTLTIAAAGGGGSGTVTSVAATVPTGFAIAGSPVTTTGTLAITFSAGYALPTTAKQTEWDTAYTDRNKWDGGATGLTAATGRTSLGLGTAAVAATGDFAPIAHVGAGGTAHADVIAAGAAGFMTGADKTKLDGVATGATANTGTVTSVGGTGTVNGITLTGTVTTTGSLTLGGTLSGVSLTTQVTGTLPVANGGTGAATLTGLVVGNGTSAFTAVTAPSGSVVGTTDTQVLTNKMVRPVVTTSAAPTTVTPNADSDHMVEGTALTGGVTIANHTGTPVNGQRLIVRLKDNGTTRTITWDTGYEAAGVALPTATTVSKWHTVGLLYNSTTSKWQCVAAVVQA